MRSDYQIPRFVHNRKDRRIFVHRDNVIGDLSALVVGQKVIFKVKPPIHDDGRDWQAAEVRVIGDVEAAEETSQERTAGRRRRRRDRERASGGDADRLAKAAKTPTDDTDKPAKSNKPAKAEPSTARKKPPPLDPITPDEGEGIEDGSTSKGRAGVTHGVLGKMKVHTIPHYAQIIPLNSVKGDFPSVVPVDALVWEQKAVPDAEVGADPTWEARPVNPSLLPLQRIMGMKGEDEDGNEHGYPKLTLHFVLSREHSAFGLKTATVGPIGRDTRYAKFFGKELDENELIRMGIREPKELAPLETGQELASAAATEAEGNTKKDGEGTGNKGDLAKPGNNDRAPAGDADKKPNSGIQFHQGQGPKT